MNDTDEFNKRRLRAELEAIEYYDKSYWVGGQDDDIERHAHQRR